MVASKPERYALADEPSESPCACAIELLPSGAEQSAGLSWLKLDGLEEAVVAGIWRFVRERKGRCEGGQNDL
jgi:hypothetical protein